MKPKKKKKKKKGRKSCTYFFVLHVNIDILIRFIHLRFSSIVSYNRYGICRMYNQEKLKGDRF